MSTKNYNDTIGNRTGDLPACSAVPQPTAPPRAMQVSCAKWRGKFQALAMSTVLLEIIKI
jgi:hypothetical protein